MRYSCQILMKLEFSRRSFEKKSTNKFNYNQVGVELFHADGRTAMAKLIVAFRYFSNEPKNWLRSRFEE